MNKKELVARVQERSGLTRTQSVVAVDAVLSEISAALVSDEKVTLVGLGTFEVKTAKSRHGNVKNVSFKTSTTLKRSLEENG